MTALRMKMVRKYGNWHVLGKNGCVRLLLYGSGFVPDFFKYARPCWQRHQPASQGLSLWVEKNRKRIWEL